MSPSPSMVPESARVKSFADYLARFLRMWIGQTALFALDVLAFFLVIVSFYAPGFGPARWITALVLLVSFLWTGYKLDLVGQTEIHDSEARLEAYEYQAPDYQLTVGDITSEIIRNDLCIGVVLDIENRSSWPGSLVKLTLDSAPRVEGRSDWSIREFGLWRHGRYFRVPNTPYSLPQPRCALSVHMETLITGVPDSAQRQEWVSTMIPLRLLIEYYTQPVGLVQEILPADVEVDLGKEFDSIAASWNSTGEYS